jgi:amino acid transporter
MAVSTKYGLISSECDNSLVSRLAKTVPRNLFVREATGLVRELSSLDVFVWSIIYFPWLTSWAGIFWVTPSYYQNVNYYAGLALWAVIAIIIVLLYWQVTIVMPRSGGDYVFISRSISGPLGFVASFLFFVAVLTSAGANSYWAFAESGTQLSFGGQVLSAPNITALGNYITPWTTPAPMTLFLAGLVIQAVGTIAIIMGSRVFRTIVYSFFIYGFLVMLLSVAIFVSHTPGDFAAAYAKYFQGGVASVFENAAAKGYVPGATFANLNAIVPLLFVSIGPYPVMQMVAGEIKNPRRSLLYGLVLAEVASILVWFGLTFIFDRVVGISFLEAWTVTVGAGSSTVPTVFVTLLEPNTLLLWVIVIGLFIGNIGWGWLGIVFISRLFMSWAFDRTAPAALASVSDRYHTPYVAIGLAAAFTVVPMALTFFVSFITAQINLVFLFAVVWFLTAVSAVLLPFRRRAIFDAAAWKPRIGGIPVLSILGVLGACLFAFLAYNSVTNPAIGPFTYAAQATILIVMIIPIVLYTVSYYYNRSRGLDLGKVMAQLPPE